MMCIKHKKKKKKKLFPNNIYDNKLPKKLNLILNSHRVMCPFS